LFKIYCKKSIQWLLKVDNHDEKYVLPLIVYMIYSEQLVDVTKEHNYKGECTLNNNIYFNKEAVSNQRYKTAACFSWRIKMNDDLSRLKVEASER